MMIPHPAAHYPQMPWATSEGAAALQPVFINPQEYQQIMLNRPPSVDSSLDSASKSGSRRGSMKGAEQSYQPKFIPSIMQKQKAMQGSLGKPSKSLWHHSNCLLKIKNASSYIENTVK